jgi:membrane dipeptidase
MISLIDLHCDTMFQLFHNPEKGNLKRNSLSVDIQKMQQGEVKASCFAMFVDLKDTSTPYQEVCKLHDLFVTELANNAETIRQVRTGREIMENDRLGAILTCEEGQILEGDLSRLSVFEEWGVRLFTLGWNYENDLAYPNSTDREIMGKGLKPLGIEAIAEMEKRHILLDVSHLSDGGFWDVVQHAKKPFLASHSNCRACASSPRNLTDDMLKALADKGGVAGLNLYPPFLCDDKLHTSRISDMVRQVKHLYKVAGSQALAIGTDFDGIDGNLEIATLGQMGKLYDALESEGFKESVLEKLYQTNALRLLCE